MVSHPINVSVAIVYHGPHGHTQRVAEAIARGVESTSRDSSRLVPVEDALGRWDGSSFRAGMGGSAERSPCKLEAAT